MSTKWFTGVSLDALHTTRSLRRQPLFVVAVVLSLALGIGAITAVVTFAQVTLLRPLPVDAPERLVQLDWQTRQWFPDMQRFVGTGVIAPVPTSPTFPGAAFEPLRTAAEEMADVFAFSQTSAISAGVHGTAREARLQMVSGSYFPALRLQAAAGRLLGPGDDLASAPPAAVISHQFWKARLAADPGAIGASLVLDGVPFTIAGVAPPGFRGTVITAPAPPDIWIPLAFSGRFSWLKDVRTLWWLSLMARLRDGATVESLAERLQHPMHTAVGEVARAQPDDLPVVRVRPGHRGQIDDTFDDTLEYTMTLAVIFTALLAVLCVNVGNLLFARGVGRRQELSVRLALGADRARLVRSLVLEGALLAAAGGVAGLFISTWGLQLLAASTLLPGVAETSLNVGTLVATTLVTFAVAVAISLFPAIKATARRQDMRVERVLRRGSASRSSRAVVCAQVAIAVVLLMGAGLLIRTLGQSARLHPGFDTNHLLLFQVRPGAPVADEGPANELVERLIQRIRRIPGVALVTASGPFLGNLWPGRIIVDRRTSPVEPRWLAVRNDFFQVLQVPVRAGRTFEMSDTTRPPRVTVIDEDLARALFGQSSALGRRLSFDQGGPEVEVVGVVARISLGGNRPADRRPTLYFPATARRADFDPENIELRGSYRDTYANTIAVRYRSSSVALVEEIRQAVAAIDPNLAVIDPKTAGEIIADRLGPTRVVATLWLAFGCATLSMTVLGLFGTMSYAVTQQTREIAIRVALGAGRGPVVRMIVGQTARVTAFGVAAGMLISTIAVQLIRSHLSGVSPYDPATAVGVTMAVGLVAAGAAIVPVRRALTIEPSSALRWE